MDEQLTVDDELPLPEADEDPPGGRHRLHRFPGRSHAFKVLYGDDEVAVVVLAAGQAGLRPSSYIAAAALAMATGSTVQAASSADRQLLAELLQVRTAVRQYGVNLNQVAAKLKSGGEAPVWIRQEVAGGDRALATVDAVARLLARKLS